MKSQRKINFLFFFIITGLIVALITVSIQDKNSSESQNSNQISKLQLIEVKTEPERIVSNIYGIVNAEEEIELKMNVSGKIDHDNRSLQAGTSFKKNDILIKIDRLEILYDILISRLNYKKHIQESLQKIGEQFPNDLSKWQEFEAKIERTLPLPDLPKVTSKEEERLLNELNIFTSYYKTKKLEQKAQDYIYAASFDGFISESFVGPSTIVKANASLMKLSKTNSLQVTAHLPLHSIKDYELAKQVYFLNSKNDTIGSGRFKRIGANLSDSSKVEVLFTISSKKQSLNNLSVQITLPEPKQNYGAVLPISAVLNNMVYLYFNNEIIETPVKATSLKNDSVQVEGLPNHCFVIKNASHLSENKFN